MRALVQSMLPPAAVHQLKRVRANFGQRSAFRAFATEGPRGAYLPADQLSKLLIQFPRAIPYRYDPASLLRRGEERARQIQAVFDVRGARVLEIASHDGMVCAALARAGAIATASALDLSHIDPRVREAGAKAEIADAGALPFEDGSFDVVFSYNAFEHFSDPDAVLSEALRVLRPNGVAYFNFGPLYRSSYGLHAMHSITVPFCQFLWERPVLDAYIADRQLRRIEYETLNEWSIKQFRALWAKRQPWGETILYREVPSVHGVQLIQDHPECFRGKVESFEDLITAVIEIAMRRTALPLSKA